MARKVDGIVEAVRYRNGQVHLARAYERRGAAFSDLVLIERAALIDRLRQGQRFAVGIRRELWAGTFEVGREIMLVSRDGGEWITTRADVDRDELEGAPVF
jgi:hypothetical protein